MIFEFWNKPRTIYPSIFRVIIGMVLLLDLIFTFPTGSFQFDSEYVNYPFLGNLSSFLRDNYTSFYVVYGVVLVSFVLGVGKNFVSLLVFIFYFLTHFISPYLMNWGDTILKFTLLYFIFVDSFRFLSIQKNRLSNNNFRNYLSQLAVWSIILNLFLIYISNGFYKSMDADWQRGFAPFYSFSQFSGFETSVFYPIISNESLSKVIAYLIIGQQLTFVPLIIWKKTRLFAIALGVIIHLIMFYQFGLWKFEAIMILLYGFLLNDDELRKIIPKKLKNKFMQTS